MSATKKSLHWSDSPEEAFEVERVLIRHGFKTARVTITPTAVNIDCESDDDGEGKAKWGSLFSADELRHRSWESDFFARFINRIPSAAVLDSVLEDLGGIEPLESAWALCGDTAFEAIESQVTAVINRACQATATEGQS